MTQRIMTWMAGLVLLGLGASLGQEKKSFSPAEIKCWWKTDRNAVQFGQPFKLTLTCQLVDSVSMHTVIEDGLLEGIANKLTPFEIMAVKKYQDLTGESFRFIQYQYILRLMADGLWGKDLEIPSLQITYKVRHTVKDGETLEGQPQFYVMSAYPVRLLSLVPKEAKDIRDAGADNFGYREVVASRAKLFLTAAALLSVLAVGIFVGLAWVGVRRLFAKETVKRGFFSRRALLRRLHREWKKIAKIRAKQGWSGDLLVRAMTVLRVVGAVALNQKVPQRVAQVEERGLEGQLKLRKGWLWPKKIMVSSHLAPGEMERMISRTDRYGRVLHNVAKMLEKLSLVRYGHEQTLDAETLDVYLKQGQVAIRSVRRYNFWVVRRYLSVRERLAKWWVRLWIRS